MSTDPVTWPDDPFPLTPSSAEESARVRSDAAMLTAAADRLEQLLAGATPGPWVLEESRESITGPTACIMVPLPPHPGARTGLTRLARVGTQDAVDAELIVALVNAGPALVALFRRLAWMGGLDPDLLSRVGCAEAIAVARQIMGEDR